MFVLLTKGHHGVKDLLQLRCNQGSHVNSRFIVILLLDLFLPNRNVGPQTQKRDGYKFCSQLSLVADGYTVFPRTVAYVSRSFL